MKVYQMIYTSVKTSISDPELGLANQPGLRVFSCTQGLTKQNIDEIIRFATYRLPKNNDILYGDTPCDPEIPMLFPKIFRTFKLRDGKYTAMQISYAGFDFEGNTGNIFAHAFVFDEVDDDFIPEMYFGHPKYRTHLTEDEINAKIVHYLDPLDDIAPTEGLEGKIIEFVNSRKSELSYILDRAMRMLTSSDIKNLCIATNEPELTLMYLLSLKFILPRDGASNLGISTYNVYLPSDKQRQIVFHGTVKGRNNITEQAVESRKTCIYVDVENTRFERDTNSILYKLSVPELRENYAKYKFTTPQQLLAWQSTYDNTTKSGIAGKLLRLKKTAGDEIFRLRVEELYPALMDTNMSHVRYELSKILFDNLHLFEENREEIIRLYLDQYLEKLCSGENVVISVSQDEETALGLAETVKANIRRYIAVVRKNYDNISEKNKLVLLRLFGSAKHISEDNTWKKLFDNEDDLKFFIHMASQTVITDSNVTPFESAEDWTENDLAELIAYFDSSTKDAQLKKSCEKFICSHLDVDWEKYGVTIIRTEKTPDKQEKDIKKIRRMLSGVGYIPYQRGTYASIRGEVTDDIRSNKSPLLLSRLIYTVYRWQSSYGNQREAERNAYAIRELLMEMRRTQLPCYNFVIPKLALEIIESHGHYHELIINAETMPPSFWDWFLIGYERCRNDDDKLLTYTRVYIASKDRLADVPAKKRMQTVFRDIAD